MATNPPTAPVVEELRLPVDPAPRYRRLADGTQQWGSGTGSLDTVLTRTGPGALSLNGSPLGSIPSIYNVKNYGAVGDNVTDDTAAIQAAIDACYAAGGGLVYFPQGMYFIGGALITARSGNSQLTVPINGTAASQICIGFVTDYGVDAAVGPYFVGTQTAPQINRTVLRSNMNFTGGVSNGNEPVVIGGPNPAGGYGSGTAIFNNVSIFWDGISILVPNVPDHGVGGADWRGCAKATGRTFSCLPNANPSTMTKPSGTGWSFGWAGPNNGNNDKSGLEDAAVYGQTYGYILGEHTTARALRAISCYHSYGIVGAFNGVGAQHVTTLTNCSAEAVATNGTHMILINSGAQVEATLDIEDTTLNIVDQSTAGQAIGTIRVYGQFANFATNLPAATSNVKIINGLQPPGYWSAAPAPAATTVAQQNKAGRDAAIVVTGGTVTAINVDGQATGYTATGATIIVPAGKTWSWTGTGAPTAKWFLL